MNTPDTVLWPETNSLGPLKLSCVLGRADPAWGDHALELSCPLVRALTPGAASVVSSIPSCRSVPTGMGALGSEYRLAVLLQHRAEKAGRRLAAALCIASIPGIHSVPGISGVTGIVVGASQCTPTLLRGRSRRSCRERDRSRHRAPRDTRLRRPPQLLAGQPPYAGSPERQS